MKRILSGRLSVPILLVGLAACPALAPASIVLGQIDDFQDFTEMNWGGGALPYNVPTDGPGGVGDAYLEVTSTGTGGSGSRLGTFNDFQWTGDYITAGVTGIDLDMRNPGNVALEMRILLLFGAGGHFTSAVPVVVPPDNQWHNYYLGLTPADLAAVDGGFNANATLSNVPRLLLRHDPGTPSGINGAPAIAAILGVDNITAVPEPSTALLLALLGGLTARRPRRRH